jgi:hypothetical protein
MTSSLLPRRRKRAAVAVLAALAAAVPVAGCGSSSGSSGGGGNAGADPAAFLPASAPVYVELQVRPSGDLAENAEAVAGKVLRTSDPAGKVVGWLDAAIHDKGASYERDVAPWLGQRAGLAVMGIGASGSDPDVVLAVASKDDDAAQKFVDARTTGGRPETYRGVRYTYKASDDLAAAVVDHVVLVGTDKAFKSAVDAQSGAKLADAGAFKAARAAVGTDGLGFLYADPLKAFNLVPGAAGGSLSSGNAQGLKVVQQLLAGTGLQSVAASLNVAKDAVQVDAAAVGLKAGAAGAAGRGDGPGAAAAVPAGSWLSLGIGDVGGAVQSALRSSAASGMTGGMDPETLLNGLKSQLGVDVDKDLLSWMGDAALFVRGTSKATLGGALVVRSKDPAASRAAVPKIRKLLKGLGVKAGAVTSSGGTTEFSVSEPAVPGGAIDVAAKDDKFVIAIGSGAVEDALGGGATLGSTDVYRTASGLLGDTRPSLFVDTPQVVKLLSSFAGSSEKFAKAKPTLDTFGPAAAGLSTTDGVVHLKAAISVP